MSNVAGSSIQEPAATNPVSTTTNLSLATGRKTYAGDGNASHLIVIGFIPKWVVIANQAGTQTGGIAWFSGSGAGAFAITTPSVAEATGTFITTASGGSVDVGLIATALFPANTVANNYTLYAFG